MNRFDEMYDIRLAKYEEIDEIMHFLDENWKKGHILATNREFFEYEHVINGQVTFLIAKEKETESIQGILGFLPASEDKAQYDIWSVLWKVKETVKLPLLGIELNKRLTEYLGARTKLGVGVNPQTAIPLVKNYLHEKVGKMKHYYFLAQKENYSIAKVTHVETGIISQNEKVFYERLATMDEVLGKYKFSNNSNTIPYKAPWYVERRYFNHPIYSYQVFGVSEREDDVEALLVCREQEYQGEKVLRIVDFMGKQKLFGGLYFFAKEQLKKYEYIDFYCYGFEKKYVCEAGFTELLENDTNIIPNYFEPFVQENIDIWVTSSKENCMFFKADADQDRPNE